MQAEWKLFEILGLAEMLISTSSHEEMIDLVLQKSAVIFNCRVCIVSKKKGRLVLENGIPREAHGIGDIITPERGEQFLKKIVDDGQIVVVYDPLHDKRTGYLKPLVDKYQISAILFSPMGEDIGMLIFDTFEGRTFGKEDVRLAKILSHIVSTAIHREQREKKERAEMLRNERMVVLGQNAATVAHTIRNILSPMKGFASLIVERASSPMGISQKEKEELKENAEVIYSSVKKMEKVVKNVLAFSATNVHLEKCNLNMLLAEEVGKLRFTYKELVFKVKIDTRLSLVSFMVDRGRFLTCLDDLVRNAIEAGATRIFLKSKLSKMACIISVIDNGNGIDSQIIDDIFMPFMTSKYDGTGLGLANVKAVIENHNGEITVKSEKGRTEFEISLPLPGTK